MTAAARRLWGRLKATRAMRAWTRFTDARGGVLAAGVAYFAFFSVFPGVALVLAVLGRFAASDPQLYAQLLDSLNSVLPGFIQTPQNPDGVIAVTLPSTVALTWTGAIAAVSLVLSGAGWLGALRDGLRAVLGAPGGGGNAVTARLRDLGVMVALGVLVLVSIGLSSVVTSAADSVASWLGSAVHPATLTVLGLGVGALAHTATMVVLLRVLADAALPWRATWPGAVLGGLALSVMTYFGGQLVALGVRNPVFGALVGVVGLLFWLNLVAKVVLLSAAFAAVGLAPADEGDAADGPAPDEPAPHPGH